MRHGAHLYGTDTPASDFDIKGVFVPDARDILLQRVQDTVRISPEKSADQRNLPGDVDHEVFSLQRYLDLLAEGQSMALDMLFAPDAAMTRPPAPLWREIQANAPRLVSRRASVFLRYCRQQANKYGLKGSRVAVARCALAVLRGAEARLGSTAKLGLAALEIAEIAGLGEHTALIDLPTADGALLAHLDVCGKRMPLTITIKSAREIIERLVDTYGQRALRAARNDGVDWKALSHAMRVGRQAVELFTTGRIIFPLRCADELLAIKRGGIAYADVAARIEQLLHEVEAAAAASCLPDAPDQAYIDDLVARAHRRQIVAAP